MQRTQRYQEARRVTLIGAGINIFLGLSKVVFGLLGHSSALVADGIHSFSDLLTDALVLFAAKLGSQAADLDHPYGHQRIETVATVALAILVAMAGIGIMLDSIWDLVTGKDLVRPGIYVLAIAAISVLANEWLFRFTLKVGKQLNSNLLKANAWHSRSDALSSLVVLLGVGGALLGYLYLDDVAAVIVGMLVVKMGWDLAWSSVRELVDTGLEPEALKAIEAVIQQVPGVLALHCLRTRLMAGDIYVDVHILVERHLTVSEGHYIGQQVHLSLVEQFASITDVTVHVDPEEDGMAALSESLPARRDLVPKLLNLWRDLPGGQNLKDADIALHYLQGQLEVVVQLPLTVFARPSDAAQLCADYQQACAAVQQAIRLRLIYA